MKPVQFEIGYDVDAREDLVRDILEKESWDEESEQLSRAMSTILDAATRSIEGLGGFDGACPSVGGFDERSLRLHGDAFWLGESFGSWVNIDISRLHDPLLYSFKYLDDWESQRQTFYIAKNQNGWVYARAQIEKS